MKEHEDFISDMTLAEDGRTLLCAGGDGYLSVWNRKSGVRPTCTLLVAITYPRLDISIETPQSSAARAGKR